MFIYVKSHVFWQRQPRQVIEKVVRYKDRLAGSLNWWRGIPVGAVICASTFSLR